MSQIVKNVNWPIQSISKKRYMLNTNLRLIFCTYIIIISSCTKEEDMRKILKPDERSKSYIPQLNGQYARLKVRYGDTIYYESIYYRTYSELVKKNTTCPNGYDCEYFETFNTDYVNSNSGGPGLKVRAIHSDGKQPSIQILAGKIYNVYLKNDFSGYDSTRVKYIGNYTQNNKQYKDVIIVFEDNGFNEIYFSKYAGVIKLFNPNTNEGIELY